MLILDPKMVARRSGWVVLPVERGRAYALSILRLHGKVLVQTKSGNLYPLRYDGTLGESWRS